MKSQQETATTVEKIENMSNSLETALAEEKQVLMQVINKCGSTLSKRYVADNDHGNLTWETARIMVKVGKYHVALKATQSDVKVDLVVYTRTSRGSFNSEIAGRGWATCREKTPLNDILEAIVEELKKHNKTQINDKTNALLAQI